MFLKTTIRWTKIGSPGKRYYCFSDVYTLLTCCSYGFSDLSAFPFHWCCFEILIRVLTGSTEIGQIDKDLLYHVMLGLSPQYSRYLEIDYGNLTGVEQFWDCVPGEEVRHSSCLRNVRGYILMKRCIPVFCHPSGNPWFRRDPSEVSRRKGFQRYLHEFFVACA